VWRTQRLESDVQLAVYHGDVAVTGQSGLDKSPSLLFGAFVVGRDEADKLGLGLIGDHLEQVREVLSLHAQLDDFGAVEVSDGDTLGNTLALLFKLRDPFESVLDGASGRLIGFLEAL